MSHSPLIKLYITTVSFTIGMNNNNGLISISRITLVYYCKCCNLIGKSIIFLAHFRKKSRFQLAFFNAMFLCNILCLDPDSTKTRLLALDFYKVIADFGCALINYHLIEISSSFRGVLGLQKEQRISNILGAQGRDRSKNKPDKLSPLYYTV